MSPAISYLTQCALLLCQALSSAVFACKKHALPCASRELPPLRAIIRQKRPTREGHTYVKIHPVGSTGQYTVSFFWRSNRTEKIRSTEIICRSNRKEASHNCAITEVIRTIINNRLFACISIKYFLK